IVLAPGTLPTVIDWEFARCGDPAYEFAIVTRGVKRPFQTSDGLARLLEAYQRHGGSEVKAEHVHIHELALIAGWYRAALNARGHVAAEQERDRMRGFLRRLRGERCTFSSLGPVRFSPQRVYALYSQLRRAGPIWALRR